MKKKNTINISWYFALFYTGMFSVQAYLKNYHDACITAGIAIGLFIVAYARDRLINR